MSSGNVFRIAFVISVAAHTALVVPWPHFDILSKKPEIDEKKPIEVSYLEIKIVPKAPVIKQVKHPVTAKIKLKAEETTTQADSKIEKVRAEEKETISVAKTQLKQEEPKEADPARPNIKLDTAARKIAYVGYYDLIRQKIKYNLFKMYRPRNRQGEVYVEFILDSDGKLKDARVLNEKSTQSKHLQEVTIKALRRSSPFPPFPEELNDPKINFNVVISFRE